MENKEKYWVVSSIIRLYELAGLNQQHCRVNDRIVMLYLRTFLQEITSMWYKNVQIL